MTLDFKEINQPLISEREFIVNDFGALPDGFTLNTDNIQRAINLVSEEGGGTLLFPAGVWLTGTIVLKTGVELYLEEGAVLKGSIEREHYRRGARWWALILAEGQQDIAIRGDGTIDGQGQALALNIDRQFHNGKFFAQEDFSYNWRRRRPNEEERPQIIEMIDCERVEVSGIHILDAACWVQTYNNCRHLLLDKLWIDSDRFWNNDGIDIDNCCDVQVSHCDINSADDGVCLKSGSPDGINKRIRILDCRIRSSASAVKFGTASHGGFRNIQVKNITVHDTYRSAIALESVDGGTLENIDISDVFAWNTGNAVFIRLGRRKGDKSVGICRNIEIRNLKAQIALDRADARYNLRGPGVEFFHNAIPASITGIPGASVENVTLRNIEINYPGRADKGLAYIPLERLDSVPEVIEGYPEYTMFQELPAWGFYCRHVKNLAMKAVVLRLNDDDYRPAFVFDDYDNLNLERISLPRDSGTEQIVLKNGNGEQLGETSMFRNIRVL